jgi:hypothetical protein
MFAAFDSGRPQRREDTDAPGLSVTKDPATERDQDGAPDLIAAPADCGAALTAVRTATTLPLKMSDHLDFITQPPEPRRAARIPVDGTG